LLQLWGAGGGTGPSSTPGSAGAGGYVEANVQLNTGTTYVFLIGQGGISGSSSKTFPDGGGADTGGVSGSGGGSTRFGPYTQSGFNLTTSSANYNNTNAVYYLIAGGGGGSSNWVNSGQVPNAGTKGGWGGGTTGAAGGSYYNADGSTSPGGGATQSAGGTAGTGGRLGSGSAGAKYSAPTGTGSSGGGGGGGYYGGGSAAGYYATGGGGSGFINSSFTTNGVFYTASSTNNYTSPNPRTNKPSNTGNGAGGSVNSVYAGNDGGLLITLTSIT
jgi:hypothetical protein